MLEIDIPYKNTELEKADRLQNGKTFWPGDFFGLSEVHRDTEKSGLALGIMLLQAVAIEPMFLRSDQRKIYQRQMKGGIRRKRMNLIWIVHTL